MLLIVNNLKYYRFTTQYDQLAILQNNIAILLLSIYLLILKTNKIQLVFAG